MQRAVGTAVAAHFIGFLGTTICRERVRRKEIGTGCFQAGLLANRSD